MKKPLFNVKADDVNGRVIAEIYSQLNTAIVRILQKNKTNTVAIRNEVGKAITDTLQASTQYASVAIPDHYLQGLKDAEKVLNEIGIRFAGADPLIHQPIVNAMASEMSLDFAKNLQALQNGIAKALSEADRIKIRAAIGEQGVTVKEIEKEVRQVFDARGVQSLLDRGGKTWSVDTYAQMLVRTKRSEAYNSGIVNRSLEINIVVFQVSYSGTAHKACQVWENKFLSVNGEHGLPTIAQAKGQGLFHPNCFHILLPAPLKQMELEKNI